jgi:hypothetical protein
MLNGYISSKFCHWNFDPKHNHIIQPKMKMTKDEAYRMKMFLRQEGYSNEQITYEFSKFEIK